jgi:histidinol dehydrogenase
MAELELLARRTEAALTGCRPDQRKALEAPPRVRLPRAPAAAGLELHRSRRHAASARRSPRSTASASTCRAARRPTRSSVLMNAIPAKVAGVGELIMVVPTPRGEKNRAGAGRGLPRRRRPRVHHRRRPGRGALAYGTQTVPQVDKIVGPGNAYVAAPSAASSASSASTWSPAPPKCSSSADGSTNPDWVAMDLFAQAEHDELAQSILLCPDGAFIDRSEPASIRSCCRPCRAAR